MEVYCCTHDNDSFLCKQILGLFLIKMNLYSMAFRFQQAIHVTMKLKSGSLFLEFNLDFFSSRRSCSGSPYGRDKIYRDIQPD